MIHLIWSSATDRGRVLPLADVQFKYTKNNSMNQSDYCQLARLLEPAEIGPELLGVLEAIAQTATVE